MSLKCKECGKEGEYLVRTMDCEVDEPCFNCNADPSNLERISTSLFAAHTNAANSRSRTQESGGLPSAVTLYLPQGAPIPGAVGIPVSPNEIKVYKLVGKEIVRSD